MQMQKPYTIQPWQPFDRTMTPERYLWLKALKDGNEKVIQAELLRCQRDRWYWLQQWVLTENAHSVNSTTFEPFPDDPHLYYVTRIWERERKTAWPKSRQITMTWLIMALYLHDFLFFPSRLNFIQSKKEEDSDAVLERGYLMYQKLPVFMRNWQPLVYGKKTHCHMRGSRNRSHLWAVPEGPDQIRGNTATGLMSDETVFQDAVERMLTAADPALGKAGRLTMLSSAGPSVFQQLCFDQFNV